MAKGKSTAEKDGSVSCEPGGGIDWQVATGSTVPQLQRHLVNEVVNALGTFDRLPEDQKSRRMTSAIAMLEGIKPQGEIEGLLAAQMVATHSAAMECIRQAMADDQTFKGRDQSLRLAAKLLSIYTRQIEVLDKHRGKGQQKITVEHFNVESGGQAIVGHMEAGKRERRKRAGETVIEHKPEVPLETSDLETLEETPLKTPVRR